MKAREYDKVIEIWQTTEVADGYGGMTITDELIARSWAKVSSVSNNSRYVGRLTDLGVTDPSNAIIVRLRKRNDLTYNAINQYLKYRGVKYIIQNDPANIDFSDVDIEIIATKEATQSVTEITSLITT